MSQVKVSVTSGNCINYRIPIVLCALLCDTIFTLQDGRSHFNYCGLILILFMYIFVGWQKLRCSLTYECVALMLFSGFSSFLYAFVIN